MSGFLDPFGKLSKKQRKKMQLAQNKEQGRMAENVAAMCLAGEGYEVERTGRGSDLRARKKDIFGRVIKSELHEVKSGGARLSKLQQKTKKKKNNYKVDRFGSF